MVNISPSPRLNRVYRQADRYRETIETGASLPIVKEIGIASLTCSFYDPPLSLSTPQHLRQSHDFPVHFT